MNNPTLHVRIISPQRLILNTRAFSVSSKNGQGTFDILPMHANFITVVENEPIIIRMEEKNAKNLTLKFPIAIIYNQNNQVNIYTYITYILPKHHDIPGL